MRATWSSCQHPLALHEAFASSLILYSQIAALLFNGLDLRDLPVRQLSLDVYFVPSLQLSLDAPCKVEDIPAVDAIVLSVCCSSIWIIA
jgi:hypothetical protein